MLRIVRVVRALVVVGLRHAVFDGLRRVFQILGIVQRRVLREVVEVVRRRRREHGGRRTVRRRRLCRRVVGVRQEVHIAARVGMLCDVLTHRRIRLGHLVSHTVFQRNVVEQADRVRACDARRHVAVFVHLRRVQAQR